VYGEKEEEQTGDVVSGELNGKAGKKEIQIFKASEQNTRKKKLTDILQRNIKCS